VGLARALRRLLDVAFSARLTSLPRAMIRPLVINSSRICITLFQPALRSAGVMNFVQMSRSLRSRLSMMVSRKSRGVATHQPICPQDLPA
jgi:hypothetical protein